MRVQDEDAVDKAALRLAKALGLRGPSAEAGETIHTINLDEIDTETLHKIIPQARFHYPTIRFLGYEYRLVARPDGRHDVRKVL